MSESESATCILATPCEMIELQPNSVPAFARAVDFDDYDHGEVGFAGRTYSNYIVPGYIRGLGAGATAMVLSVDADDLSRATIEATAGELEKFGESFRDQQIAREIGVDYNDVFEVYSCVSPLAAKTDLRSPRGIKMWIGRLESTGRAVAIAESDGGEYGRLAEEFLMKTASDITSAISRYCACEPAIPGDGPFEQMPWFFDAEKVVANAVAIGTARRKEALLLALKSLRRTYGLDTHILDFINMPRANAVWLRQDQSVVHLTNCVVRSGEPGDAAVAVGTERAYVVSGKIELAPGISVIPLDADAVSKWKSRDEFCRVEDVIEKMHEVNIRE